MESVLQLLLEDRETEALAKVRSALGHFTTETLCFDPPQAWDETRNNARLVHLYVLSAFLLDEELWDEAVMGFASTIKLSEALDDVYFLDSARCSKAFCHKMLGQRREMLKEREMLDPEQTYFVGVAIGFLSPRDLVD